MQDFGYPCTMPREITIDGLFVDDSRHPEGYTGLYLFTDPGSAHTDVVRPELPPDRPFPYARSRKVTLKALSTASGKRVQLSPNSEMQHDIAVVEQE